MEAPPTDRLISWIVTLGITALAFFLRFVNLSHPKNIIFDETYYAKDAFSLLRYGYEREWPKTANDDLLKGILDSTQNQAEFFVHPPLGKWLIASGEWLFGMNAFGWRIAACIFGSLLIMVTIRLARRLARSTLVGAIAGLLLTFDGLEFVMSRVALLDIFLTFFIVSGVSCLLADRDFFRNRLGISLNVSAAGRTSTLAKAWYRPWLWLAGLNFGLALACKWSALYFIAAFGLVTVFWSWQARRLAKGKYLAVSFLIDSLYAFFWLVIFSAGVYLATWISWFVSTDAWKRNWAETNPDSLLVKYLGPNLASWVAFQQEIYSFHTGKYINEQTHPYDAPAWGWLFMWRPTSMSAVNGIQNGTDGCTASDNCLRVITGMGTPLLWWLALVALIYAVYRIFRKDWRFSAPIIAVMAAWLPWFNAGTRPIFTFYAVLLIPFTVTILALALGDILEPPDSLNRRRGAIIVGLIIGFVILNFLFIYPILTSELLSRSQWQWRMWFPSWI